MPKYTAQKRFHCHFAGLHIPEGGSLVHNESDNTLSFLDAKGNALTNELQLHLVTDPPTVKAYLAENVTNGNLTDSSKPVAKAAPAKASEPAKTESKKPDAPPPPADKK